CGFAHLLKIGLGCGLDDGAHQLRKHLPENLVGEVFGNTLFVKLAFFEGFLVEGARNSARRHECLSPEDKVEDLQPMATVRLIKSEKTVIVPRQAEDRGDVEFEELLGH